MKGVRKIDLLEMYDNFWNLETMTIIPLFIKIST